eukprot:5122139-Pyramimonas_sp.AAC.1
MGGGEEEGGREKRREKVEEQREKEGGGREGMRERTEDVQLGAGGDHTEKRPWETDGSRCVQCRCIRMMHSHWLRNGGTDQDPVGDSERAVEGGIDV